MSRINEAASVIVRAGELGRQKALRDVAEALGDEHGFDCRSLKAPMSDKHGPCDCGAGRVRALLAVKPPEAEATVTFPAPPIDADAERRIEKLLAESRATAERAAGDDGSCVRECRRAAGTCRACGALLPLEDHDGRVGYGRCAAIECGGSGKAGA